MKILVAKDRNLGGKFVSDFCSLIAELGHEVCLCSDSLKEEVVSSNMDERVCRVNLADNFLKLGMLGKLRHIIEPAPLRYTKFVSEYNPDLIVCYMLKDVFNVGWVQNKIRVIAMIHNFPPYYFDAIERNFFRRILYTGRLRKVWAYNLLLESFSKTSVEWMDNKPKIVIGNVIDQVKLEDRTDLSHSKKTILYVGRLERNQKRPHLLIEAFGLVGESFLDWKLIFYGGVKDLRYYNELLEQVQDLGLSGRVFFHGFTTDIKRVYRDADILAWPAAYEGQSIGLSEGMAHGLPCIGFSDAPSVNEIIVDGLNGFLAANTNDFSKKLVMLMANQALRIELGRNAVITAGNYSRSQITKCWKRVFDSIDLDPL